MGDEEDEADEEAEDDEVGEALEGPKTVIQEAPPEETEKQKKQRILRRLRTLKKIYPAANIPDFDYEDDLELMNTVLDDVSFDMKLDQNITFYLTTILTYSRSKLQSSRAIGNRAA